jgi:TPR repeat protein
LEKALLPIKARPLYGLRKAFNLEGQPRLTLYALGRAHYFGKGVPENKVKAFQCYRDAFKDVENPGPRYSHALFNLGTMIFNGEGGAQKNPFEAMRWISFAAGHGHPEAKDFISKCKITMHSR